jgi:hypothetical protein
MPPLPSELRPILDKFDASSVIFDEEEIAQALLGYQLFQSGQLPGRKVGRKWVTTKAAVIRWLEDSSATESLARAVQGGNHQALTKALKEGQIRVK